MHHKLNFKLRHVILFSKAIVANLNKLLRLKKIINYICSLLKTTIGEVAQVVRAQDS